MFAYVTSFNMNNNCFIEKETDLDKYQVTGMVQKIY